jgi:peptide/nickel transport system substrate-binding protein
LQDPAYKSPLRQSWQGVEVSQLDDYTLVFALKNPYIGFLDNLTVGLLPKHIWENIAPEKFALAEYNLHPVGSGPFMFADFQKDSEGTILTYQLVAFKDYYDSVPYIGKMVFNFYLDDDALVDAYNKKEIMAMRSIAPEKVDTLKNIKSTNMRQLVIPRYFAVFFNQTKNVALASDEVRKALELGVDRKEIIETILHGNGLSLSSPFFPGMSGYGDAPRDRADIQGANKILDDAGWKLDQDDNVRKKNGTEFSFELVTTDWPELNQTADLLAKQWQKVGAKVSVKVLTVSDLQQNYIRTREYDSLLFGQAISFNPDLYSFWHSNEKRDPGLNLSLFDNKDADGLLENIRQESDESKRSEEYVQFREILDKENPAVFLYGPYYLYPTNTVLGGMETKNINTPSERFVDVNKWFVKTKRILK